MYINLHTHQKDYTSDVYILNDFAQDVPDSSEVKTMVSCGIHPWHVHEIDISNVMHQLKEYALKGELAAIGECGLDVNIADLELQKQVFIQQILLSEEIKLPVIIHSVKQHHEILHLRKLYNCTQPWIVHGFTGRIEIFRQFIKQNIFVSLGPGFFKWMDNAKKFFKEADLHYIFLETDDTEKSIRDVYNIVINNIGIEADLIESVIADNFKRIFYKSWNG